MMETQTSAFLVGLLLGLALMLFYLNFKSSYLGPGGLSWVGTNMAPEHGVAPGSMPCKHKTGTKVKHDDPVAPLNDALLTTQPGPGINLGLVETAQAGQDDDSPNFWTPGESSEFNL